jgi:hypothetical protein
MNRNVCNSLLGLAIVALLATSSLAAERPTILNRNRESAAMHYGKTTKDQKQSVTLAINGAEDTQSADMLTSALRENGLPAKVEAKQGQPSVLTASISRSMDLSACGKSVMSANTREKTAFPPSVDLVLFAPLTKEKAKLVLDRLHSLKGVDSQNSHAIISKGELWVRINGAARVTPDDVYNAVHAAGINAHFTKNTGRQS